MMHWRWTHTLALMISVLIWLLWGGLMTLLCVCCERLLDSSANWTWCDACIAGLILDAGMLRANPAIFTTVEWLTDKGCLTLARYVVGALPFGDDRV